jgi:hypothetical protein
MDLFAYLDPGSASALLAAVLAGIAGLGAAIRTYGTNFLKKLMFWKKDEPAGDDNGPASTESAAVETPEETAEDAAPDRG